MERRKDLDFGDVEKGRVLEEKGGIELGGGGGGGGRKKTLKRYADDPSAHHRS